MHEISRDIGAVNGKLLLRIQFWGPALALERHNRRNFRGYKTNVSAVRRGIHLTSSDDPTVANLVHAGESRQYFHHFVESSREAIGFLMIPWCVFVALRSVALAAQSGL